MKRAASSDLADNADVILQQTKRTALEAIENDESFQMTTDPAKDAILVDAVRTHLELVTATFKAYQHKLHQERRALEKEKAEWQRAINHLESTQIQDPVVLNVGGTIFATSKETLFKVPGTYFAALLSGRWDVKRSFGPDGAIFIDRDPTLFGYIINYLRFYPEEDASLAYLSWSQKHLLKRECDFFSMTGLAEVISNPCHGLWQHLESRIANIAARRKLYQWSVNAWSGDADSNLDKFHKFCDKQGPTVIIATLNDKSIVGAFTSTEFDSEVDEHWEQKVEVGSTFLFKYNLGVFTPCDLKDIKTSKRLYTGMDIGIEFGEGDDIRIDLNASPLMLTSQPFTYQSLDIPKTNLLKDVEVWAV